MKARLLVLPALLLGSAAVGHIVMVVRGVHFKTDAIDFGQPPLRRSGGFDDGTGGAEPWRPGTRYARGSYEEDEALRIHDFEDKQRLLRASAAAEAKGDLAGARKAYGEMKKRGLASANFLNSRLELLNTPGIAGSAGLAAYLRATHPSAKGVLPATVGPALRPWLAYSLARSPQEYAGVAGRYPTSSRAAAALVMAARGEAASGRPSDAKAHAQALLKRYPSSRFAWDARGILGRVEFQSGRLSQALAVYEAQARAADSLARKASAFQSIVACLRPARKRAPIAYAALRWMRSVDDDPAVAQAFLLKVLGRFSGDDARAFYGLVEKDPASFAAYLELRQSLDESAKDVLDLAWKAEDAVRGTPYAPRVDAILTRVALARGDGRTDRFARGALKGKGDDHALGLFALATLDRRAGRFVDAKAGFERLLREHPAGYLSGGARENLAILDERLDDLAGAMDLYLCLGYRDDVAYLADVKMAPQELSGYVEAHPKETGLRYALAMRYLRKGEWDAAETALKPLNDAERATLTTGFVSPDQAKEEGVLQDPLTTLRDLRALDASLSAAKGPEAKAAALSTIGDYYYAHKCLLLYSGPLWGGGRNGDISFSWNPAVATEADDRALRVHHDEHECYVHALDHYQRVLKEFPNAKVAPHAAYWAAVATKRLSNMAPYWRWRDRREDLKAESIRLMGIAAAGSDPAIAKRAKKYGPVFAQERAEFRKAFSGETPPPRRWTPD